jgi:osmotically-inducible protein OsmY
MYLLDPDKGSRRRELMRDQAKTYRHWADGLLDQTSRTVGRQMRGLSRQARTLNRQAQALGEQRHDLLGRVRLPFRHEQSAGDLWRERIEQTASSKGLLLLGCLGLGAGLMYLFDSRLGGQRRALISDKIGSYWRSTGDFLGKTARDAGNRTRGLLAEASAPFRHAETPDNAVLEARVRARLGRMGSEASAIDVSAEQGRVTLHGSIPESATEDLLSAVESVAGVTEVVNRLKVKSETEHKAGAHNGNKAD